MALLSTGAAFQPANAHEETPRPAPKVLPATAAGDLASRLGEELGDDAAGAYYDTASGTLVVNVVDEDAADTVHEAGARARLVEHSLADLADARRTLEDRASLPGTSWADDPVANKVVVTADRTVGGASWEKLTRVVKELGSRAEVRRTAGTFKPLLAGGDAIYSGGARCSLGFNVVRYGQPYFLTAGHCGEAGSWWAQSPNGRAVGLMVDSRFPGDDFALVRYVANVPHPSEVNLYDGGTQPITGAGEAIVGMHVLRSGSTTQVHDGTVTGLNATVNYGNGRIVGGLIQTTVCAEPGDSGGPLFTGETAIGLTSGGSGDCTSGGVTFFQPVTEALAVYRAQVG